MQNAGKLRVVGYALIAVLSVMVVIGVKWLQHDFSPHKYGIKQLNYLDDQKVFIKREVGLHYDRTALSLNDERCTGPDDDSDYTFIEQDAGAFPIYYKFQEHTLRVYERLTPPKRHHWPIAVNSIVLNPGELARIEQDYKAQGISVVEIVLTELSDCQQTGKAD